jgi:hypothetical protein
MSRPRSKYLKIGDKITFNKLEGVVVFIEPNSSTPYSVHFYPEGRGLFKFSDLKKVKPKFIIDELENDKSFLSIKETIDV